MEADICGYVGGLQFLFENCTWGGLRWPLWLTHQCWQYTIMPIILVKISLDSSQISYGRISMGVPSATACYAGQNVETKS
jgi:hypothetical protein